MMRTPNALAIAIRKEDGEILVKKELLPSRHLLLKKPISRGAIALWEALVIGYKSLAFSAQKSARKGEKEMSGLALGFTMIFAIGLAILFFILLPATVTNLFQIKSSILFNLVDGLIRLLFFFGYLLAISQLKDVKRLFAYHGAEHKAVYTYEAGEDLTIENASDKSTLHPRCGTNFIFIFLILSILLFSLLGRATSIEVHLLRLCLIPIIAAFAYEIIRFSMKKNWYFINFLGLQLQKITTREPTDDQIEVALVALKEVLDAESQRVNTETQTPLGAENNSASLRQKIQRLGGKRC
ncbi:DUF1385 domain-containing protein [bacterium]|nr:DUF1385 domain-containing protein [bacterium]MBU4310094.1 DUF1385 domain-containing protein [bacterium]MBU4561730.1 DUF1385 domain-containing protein [bacterium]